MDFPTFQPSSRTYSHGEWPVSRAKFMTGRSQQMLHANGKTKQRLNLRYDNARLENLDYFIAHFNEQRGTHKGFRINETVLHAGRSRRAGDNKRMGMNMRWRYTKAPRIRSQRGKYGTIEIELETVGTTDTFYLPAEGANGASCQPECPPPPIDKPADPPTSGPKPPDGSPGGGDGGAGGDPGNGPPPSGGSGGGGGWGDGAGSGPGGGGGGGGGGGAFPGFPGSPSPTPPSCPPGQVYKDGKCVDIPELEDPEVFIKVTYQSSPTVLYETSQIAVCKRDETGCEQGVELAPVCRHETTRYGKWPFTLVKYYPGQETDTPQISNPPPPLGETPYGNFGCYSRSLGYRNYNYASTISRNPNFKSPIWEYVDAEGNAVSDPIRSTLQTTNGACEAGTSLRGDVNEPNCEIVQIIELRKGVIWQSSSYIEPQDCFDWPDVSPTSRHYEKSLEVKRKMNVLADTRSSTTSNYFPNISPSRRRITYGDYVVNRFGEDQEITMSLPSTAQKCDVTMELVYANRHDEIARMFMDHYDQCSGEFYDFPIAPVDQTTGTFAGWDDPTTRHIRKGRWIYARPPRIEQTAINYSTTTIQIINLNPQLADPEAGAGSGGSDGTFGGGSGSGGDSGSSGQGPAVPPTPNPGPGDPALLRKR